MIRVLLVDDQPVVRGGLRIILESEPDLEIAGEAASGGEAVEAALALSPDLILMDISMPGVDGIEATRRLAAGGSQARVLVLTTYGLDENVYDALKAGAAGFLVKTDPPEQLVDAVRAVANGDAQLAPEITRRLIDRFLAGAHPSRPPAELEQLTPRELEVLRLLARGSSNAEIAQRLYLGEGTVKTHVARVLAKLDLRDRTQAVVYAYENGLVQPGQE